MTRTVRAAAAAVLTVALLALGADVAPAQTGPDLAAVLRTPATPNGVAFDMTPMATNVGDAATAGPITLTFATTVLAGPGTVALRVLGTGGYTVQSTTATSIVFTQTHLMPPGSSSGLVVYAEWSTPNLPGSWVAWVFVSGGGDANPANNAAARQFTAP